MKVHKDQYYESLDTDCANSILEKITINKDIEKSKLASIPEENDYQFPLIFDEIPEIDFSENLKKQSDQYREITELVSKSEDSEISEEELCNMDKIDSYSRDIKSKSIEKD